MYNNIITNIIYLYAGDPKSLDGISIIRKCKFKEENKFS